MTEWFGPKNSEDHPSFKKRLAKESCKYVSYDALPRIDKTSGIERWKQSNLIGDSLESRNEPESINSSIALTDPNLISTYLAQLEQFNNLDYSQSRFVNNFDKAENRYVLGFEFAIAALVTCAAINRLKTEAGKDDNTSPNKVKLTKKIEDMAYNSPNSESDSIDQLKLPKCLEDYSGGFSGSLTDFMFSSHISRPTFIIGTGDTLVSIAESLYHDSKLGYLIAQLNRDRTNQIYRGDKLIVEANSRDVLKLPLGKDISEFLSNDSKNLVPEKLITIVKDTSLNKEIIEEELKPVVAPTMTWPTSTVVYVKIPSKIDKLKFKSFQTSNNKDHTELKTIVLNGIKVNRAIDH